jgi:hypothetical protein
MPLSNQWHVHNNARSLLDERQIDHRALHVAPYQQGSRVCLIRRTIIHIQQRITHLNLTASIRRAARQNFIHNYSSHF